MKIHEYQGKAILAQYHVPVPRGEVAFTVEEAEAAAKEIGGSVVVKAQIHAGGRGKGTIKDEAKAAELYRKLADNGKGFGPAMFDLGVMIEKGEGVPKNLTEAMTWYRRAADKKEPRAIKRLANPGTKSK